MTDTFQVDEPPPEPHRPEMPDTEAIRQQWHHDFEAAIHAATRLLGTAYTSLEINVGSRQAELLAPHLLESLVKGAMAEANDLQAARARQRLALERAMEEAQRQASIDPQQQPITQQRPW